MINSFRASGLAILPRTSHFIRKNPYCKYILPSFRYSGDRTVFGAFLTRFHLKCCSSNKFDIKALMKDDKEAFFVVRKGDLVGVYKSLSDCQAQVGTLIRDPPVSVYKGYMPKDTEKYLMSCGLKNALYSIRASDLTEELFGPLVSCPFQPSSSRGEASTEPVIKKRPQEALWSEYGESAGPMLPSNDALAKHLKLEPHRVDQNHSVCRSCTLEFDGASKGNPGQAGAGAVLRSDDGRFVCRLRQGLGIATNNVAEYRGFILGLRYALAKGFTSVQVRGDSKLVCMQIQGVWKVKNQNISSLFDEAKKLKDSFLSFQITHVLRDLNSEADAQANLGVDLPEGKVQEDIDK